MDHPPGSAAARAAPVDALFSRWDAARQHGQTIAPEELCRDCPQLLAELQGRIDGLQAMERFVAKGGARDDSLSLCASDAETGFNGPALKTVEEAKSCLSPPRGPDEIGWLGTYRVRKVLGAGGMGVVLLAEDSKLKRQVAVKVMAPSLAANTAARERFLREAQAAAALEHEHIVAIFQVDEHNNVPYLVMPYLKGESLEDRLARVGRLELLDAVRIAREIAEGLAAAHEHGLIHRDIKPGNIWLETRGQRSGVRSQGSGTEKTAISETARSSDQWLRTKVDRVRILDFGLARAERDDIHLTRTGEVLGTPAYMCPEQAAGEVVDQRGDLFSLGAVVYRMVTGQRPFAGDTIFAMMNSLANHQPQAPEKLIPGTPAPLSRLILRLLEKDRSRRPAGALEVANELAGIEATCFEETEVEGQATAIQSLAPQTLPLPPERRPRTPRTAIAIAALAALALLAAGIVVIIRDREGNEIARVKVPKGGSVTVDQNGKPAVTIPGKPNTLDPERKAAEWALSLGGKVTIREGDKEREIALAKDLPAGKFQLTGVDLDRNDKVTDAGLPHFKGLRNLRILTLVNNPVSDKSMDILQELRSLQELNLTGTQISDLGVSKLEKLHDLTSLYIGATKVGDAAVEHLKSLNKLVYLGLADTRVTAKGLARLKDFPKLQSLRFEFNKIGREELEKLNEVTTLTWLGLRQTQFADADLVHLRDLPKLHVLDCDYTSLGDAGLANLKGLKALKELYVTGTRISDAGLAHLRHFPNLETIYIGETKITGAGLSHLKKMSNLRSLRLEGTKVSAAGIAELRKALPKCAIFWEDTGASSLDPSKPSFTNAIGIKLMPIPAGEFLMGSPKEEADHHGSEGPRHRVVISKPFFMSAHEITQEQYQKVMGKNPSANKADPGCPVEQVTWENAVDFCERLSQHPDEKKLGRVYRLPAEAEWEYACRAGTATPFHFGASLSTAQANFGAVTLGKVEKGAPGKTVKVGSYPPNAWGLFDMHGNVREWCLDGSRSFKKTDDGITDPQGPKSDGLGKMCRGGHFSTSAAGCRSAQRQSVAPLARQPETGFRVVCTFRPRIDAK